MKQPLLVTVAIITDQNKVLLVKRAREPFKGYWSFIGGIGGFEHSSNPEEVIKMEVHGDIHCHFDPTFFMYNYQEKDVPAVVLYFYGGIRGIPQPDPDYVSEYQWAPINEVVNWKLGFDHQEILKRFWQDFLSITEQSHETSPHAIP